MLRLQMIHPLTLVQAWQKMEEFHDRGLVKSIGLSNFTADNIEELSKIWRIKPNVNQVSPYPDLLLRFRSSITRTALICL